MRVLMISLDSSLLGAEHGDTVQRHLEYARRIGDLRIVVYNPASSRKSARRFSAELAVYPANTPLPILFPWLAYRTALHLHREHPADVITAQNPFMAGLAGVMLKWRIKRPLNVQSHSTFFTNPDWINEHPIRNRVLRAVGKWVVKRADTHRVLTEYEKQVYMAMGIPAERIAVVSVPVRLEKFAAPVPAAKLADLRASLEIEPDAPVVLWVGLPVTFKNIDLLLDAFDRVHEQRPDARLLLVGDFTHTPQYTRRADPAYVRFAGQVAHDDLPPYYALAGLYAHSSRYEGVPRVLIEALAAGKPVVSTRHIGASAVVRAGETGLLCDHTPEALAAAILELLNDPARARQMGERGRTDMLRRFDYERNMAAIVETYRDTMSYGQ